MGEFKHGLCGCFDDIELCLWSYFLPCFTAGKNAEAMEEDCLIYGIASITCVAPYTNALIRTKIREKYGIEGDFIKDILIHWCCPLCGLIQNAQELKEQQGTNFS